MDLLLTGYLTVIGMLFDDPDDDREAILRLLASIS